MCKMYLSKLLTRKKKRAQANAKPTGGCGAGGGEGGGFAREANMKNRDTLTSLDIKWTY